MNSEINISIEQAKDRHSEAAKFIRAKLPEYLLELGAGPEYEYLEQYWSEAKRHPYVVKSGAEFVGLSLVRFDELSLEWELAEFWVSKSHRLLGVGLQAFRVLCQLHPGAWRVSALESNEAALSFWGNVLGPGWAKEEKVRIWRFVSGGSELVKCG